MPIMTTLNLRIDPIRRGRELTGIFVRAYDHEVKSFCNADLGELDKDSLLAYVSSIGETNFILTLLGHT